MPSKRKSTKVRVRRCELCGRPLPPQSGRGRPRVYHPDCKRASELMGWLVQTVERIDFAPEYAGAFRSNMFALANDVRTRVDHAARKQAGAKLKERREAVKMTREELAHAAAVKVHRIGHFETGQRGPSENELLLIETALRDAEKPKEGKP